MRLRFVALAVTVSAATVLSGMGAALAGEPAVTTWTVTAGAAPVGRNVSFAAPVVHALELGNSRSGSSHFAVRCDDAWPTTIGVTVGPVASPARGIRIPTTGTPPVTCTAYYQEEPFETMTVTLHNTWFFSLKTWNPAYVRTTGSIYGASMSFANMAGQPQCAFDVKGSFESTFISGIPNGLGADLTPTYSRSPGAAPHLKVSHLVGCSYDSQMVNGLGLWVQSGGGDYYAKHTGTPSYDPLQIIASQ